MLVQVDVTTQKFMVSSISIVSALDFYYFVQFVDLVESKLEKAVDIGLHQHMGMSSMVWEPEVLETESEYEE